MSLVSYAQNFEDVILWRVLHQINNGFYVDVGANDPTLDSVTRVFYDYGWHGINIEPMQTCYERLCQERARDINLNVAIDSQERELTFYEIPETGLSTVDFSIAQKHQSDGRLIIEKKIRALTLNHLFEEHVKEPIHFLKIDVEGHEDAVLRGIDLNEWRPWIIIVEATEPNSRKTNFESWEPVLLQAKYSFAYFDGINRFYVAREHSDLIEELRIPPNFFDNFITSDHSIALLDRDARLDQIKQYDTWLKECQDQLKRNGMV